MSVTMLGADRVFTRADLDAMPDDGRRHELIDGAIVVTPSPTDRHQSVLLGLTLLLANACPPDLVLRFAPYDVALGELSVIQPDLVVTRRSEVTEHGLVAAPLLAVEILSRSTRRLDLGIKKDLLEEAGCASYWIVDPTGPRLTAWELTDGAYVEVAEVGPDETWAASAPFGVSVRPVDLLR